MKKNNSQTNGAFHFVFSQSPIPMWIYDTETLKIIKTNDALINLLGYEDSELTSLTVEELFDIKETALLLPDLKRIPDPNFSFGKKNLCRKNGALITAHLFSQVFDVDGKSSLVLLMAKHIEDVLLISEARLRTLTENAPDLIAEIDRKGKVLFLNRVLLGMKMEDVIGHDFCEWVAEKDQPLLRQKLETTFVTRKTQEYEVMGIGSFGEPRWYMTRLSPVIVEDEVSCVVLIARDITERKKAEDDILSTKEAVENMNVALQKAFEHEQIASRTDNLTGVYNRRYFFEFIEYEFSISKRYQLPLSVILFDVDNFKNINDTYGHLSGDEILIAVAKNVNEELRDSDVLARYGGDEFIILTPNNNAESIRSLVERIRGKLETSTINAYGQQIKVTISAGVADMQPDIDTPTKLVHRADQALYVAKQNGRNRVAYASAS